MLKSLNKWNNISNENKSLIDFWGLNKASLISRIFKQRPSEESVFNSGLKKYFSLLNVKEDRRTGLINVNFEIESPYLAAEISNLPIEIQSYVQKQNTAKAVKEKFFIRDVDLVTELELLEENLKEFKERNRGYEASPSCI